MPNLAGAVRRTSEGTAFLLVQESVYSLEAILKTCYLFTDRCYIFLKRAEDESIEVHITPKDDKTSVHGVVGDFCNELIDQRLRAELSRESGKIREIIIAQAFAEANLFDSPNSTPERDEHNEDPLGIGDSSERRN